MKSEGARFVHITGRDIGDNIELNYHFEKGLDVTTLIVNHPKTEELLSITSIFPASFLAENELQDHLKVKVSGLSVDFGGKLLRVAAAEQDTLLKPAVVPHSSGRFQICPKNALYCRLPMTVHCVPP